jgi:hypothetical protein
VKKESGDDGRGHTSERVREDKGISGSSGKCCGKENQSGYKLGGYKASGDYNGKKKGK